MDYSTLSTLYSIPQGSDTGTSASCITDLINPDMDDGFCQDHNARRRLHISVSKICLRYTYLRRGRTEIL